jgi:hypothetical protein
VRPSSCLSGVVGFLRAAAIVTGAGMAPLAHAESDFNLGGLVDIVGRGNRTSVYLNRSMYGLTNFDNLHVRVFVEGGSERTRAYLQFLVSDVGSSNFRFYGGYVQHRLFEGREMFLQVGKIPVHEGTWAPRTYSDRNPLLGVPFAYYYKSTLPSRQIPIDLKQLVSFRGQGQVGVNYTDPDGTPRGNPAPSLQILYDNCWDYGAFLLGASTRFDYAFGVTTGAPAAPVPGPDTNHEMGLHARFGFAPVPSLHLHVSAGHGAYLGDEVQAYLPAGAHARDYSQTVWGLSGEWGWRHLTVYSELFRNHFETPIHSPGLDNTAWYLESVYKFIPGWYVAGRYDVMRFDEVTVSSGPTTWDENVQRVESGVGHHLTRDLLVKVVAQVYKRSDGWELESMLPAAQLSFRY